MANHDPQKVEVAEMFGHKADDIYGEPKETKEAKKPQGFQEEVATVEDLLGDLPLDENAGGAPPMEDILPLEVEEEAPVGDVDGLISRLQTIADMEEVSEEDKSSAEEMIARLEELKAAKTNAEEFLSEKETADVDVDVTVEGDTAIIPVDGEGGIV